MRLRYKGRRYKVNLFPILLLFLLILALILFGVSSCSKGSGNPSVSSGTSSQTGNSSGSAPAANSSGSSQESAEGVAPIGDSPSSDDGILVGGEPTSSMSAEGSSSGATSGAAVPTDLPKGTTADWNLILLNPEENNKIEKDIDVEKIKFDDQYVDARAAPAYQKMFDDAQTAGITLFLRSGYRSISTQKVNYDANVQRMLAKGNNEAEAIRLTNLYYTVPGHSEHHTGLAFDIITPEYHKDIRDLNEAFAKTEAYQWLVKNCANYGFILRYPKDKHEITDISFEPWHYRYVGVDHAKYIMSHNLCLEEYLELFKTAGR